MKRYMLLSAFLLFMGMALKSTNDTSAVFVIFAVLLVAALFCIWKGKTAAFLMCVIIPVAGFYVLNFSISHYEGLASPLYNTKCEAQCRVEGVCKYEDFAYIDVSARSITTCLGTYGETRKIRLCLYDDIPDIKYADIVKVKAILREPLAQTMSGQNRKLFLMAKGVCLTADTENIQVVGNDFSFFRPTDFAYYIKNEICSRVDEYFSGSTSGLIKGLITGDKRGLDDEVYSAFRACGLAHVVAVSGMHISILLGAAVFLFGIFKSQKRLLAIAVYILLVWLFALVAGFSASAVRAALTITIFYVAWSLNRESDPLNSLGISAVIMLLLNPVTFYDIGFRLSVSSVAGILVFADKVGNKINFLPDAVADIIAVSFAAQLGCLPVLMYHFGNVSTVSLLANLIICPVIPIIMTLTVAGLILCRIPVLGFLILKAVKILTDGVISVVLVLGNVPHASHVTGSITLIGIAAYLTALAVLWLCLCGKRRKAAYCTVLLLAIISFALTSNACTTRAQLAFLNVGSGDCAIFASRDVTIMIDSGGMKDVDIAKKAIIPYMEKAGIDKIDFAFVSHYHADHCGGYITLLEEGKIKTLLLSLGIYEGEMKEKLEHAADISKTDLGYIKSGESVDCAGFCIEAFNTYTDGNENNGMVYYLDWGNTRVCFAGDTEKSGEERLYTRFPDMHCDILKVSHHGSKTSTSEGFVRAAEPRYAVVSRKGEIPKETRKTLIDYGADVFSTYNLGTIIFNMNKTRIISIHSGRGFDNEF